MKFYFYFLKCYYTSNYPHKITQFVEIPEITKDSEILTFFEKCINNIDIQATQ